MAAYNGQLQPKAHYDSLPSSRMSRKGAQHPNIFVLKAISKFFVATQQANCTGPNEGPENRSRWL